MSEYPSTLRSYTPISASKSAGFSKRSVFFARISSSAAPFKKLANTSGPNASDNTAPPTAELEEYLPPM